MEQKHSFLRRKRRGIIPYEIKLTNPVLEVYKWTDFIKL